MVKIEKKNIIDSNKLSGESYVTSIIQEACVHGLMNNSEVKTIQLQCIEFLAYKTKKYNFGESSSIRVETAESIMKSNLYTVGLYLKSLPADSAIAELKKTGIPELYHKGRALLDFKVYVAKRIYKKAKLNKIKTSNYTYNATLDDEGIGIFFKSYNPDYAAHEAPGSIDYQLCNPVIDLTGIEFIEKYLENLFLENQFCNYFEPKNIHHLLCGYDAGYKDLLINIFEQVLTGSVGCVLTNRSVKKLFVSESEIRHLYKELSNNKDQVIVSKIHKAIEKVFQELNNLNELLQRYIKISLPKISSYIVQAVRTNSLSKTFVSPYDTESKTKIKFFSGLKMDNAEYRQLIAELLICQNSSAKIDLIKQNVKSFGDIEDILFDAMLSKNEITSVFEILGNVELAALIKSHPYHSEVQAVDLSESEQVLRGYLKSYVDQLSIDRQEQIFNTINQLVSG